MKRWRWFFLLAFGMAGTSAHAQSCSESGCESAGTLYAVGGSYGFDWHAPKPYVKALAPDVPLKLQARFVWRDTDSISDHAIVAFVQGENPYFGNAPAHAEFRSLWTYGAGAFVGSGGLSLELWFNPTAAFHGSAYLWNNDDRCGAGVNAEPANACVADRPGAPEGWVSALPQSWAIRPHRPYWVRLTILNGADGWSSMDGELIEEAPSGLQIVQTARLGFPTAAFFPKGNAADGLVARSPGSGADIDFWMFDYGF